jgi:hypothetical protein
MRKSAKDQIAKITATTVGIAAAAGAAVMVLTAIPDLIRYVRIKLM